MAFKSPKQRAYYFAKKSGKPSMPSGSSKNAQVNPMAAPQNLEQPTTFKIPGLPKQNKFGRIKKNFKF